MFDNSEFKIRLEEDTFMDYEKIILASGSCNMFIPMGFMGDDSGETVLYNCSGFVPLRNFKIEKTQDALFILERTVHILEKSIEHMIMPAKITLTLDTVFYNPDTMQIKVAYVPISGYRTTLRKNMVRFIGMIMRDIKDNDRGKLVEIANYIYKKNYSMRDIVNKIGMVKMELQ